MTISADTKLLQKDHDWKNTKNRGSQVVPLSILDRYILRLWWQPFIGAILLVTTVLLLGRTLKLLGMFATKQIDWSVLGVMLVAITPSFLIIALPMAFLFAIQHLLIRLQQDNEMDALQAAGISYLRLLRPVFTMALLLWIVLSWMSLQWMPQGLKKFQVLMMAIGQLKAAPSFQPQRIDQSFDNLTVYIKGKDANGVMHGLMLEDRRYNEPVIYLAQSAELTHRGGKLLFTLYHGTRLEGHGDTLRTIRFARYQIAEDAKTMGLLKLPTWNNHAFEMTLTQLWQSTTKKPNRIDLTSELYQRFILPSTIFLLAMFALPLSIRPKRSNHTVSYLLGIALVLVIDNSQIILHQQVLNRNLPPWTMWLGQGVFFVLACRLFHSANNGKIPINMIAFTAKWKRRRCLKPLQP